MSHPEQKHDVNGRLLDRWELVNVCKCWSAKEQHERLLRKLHSLDMDSPAADDIRDEMDIPWHAMTEAEQLESQKLSEKLYEDE